MTAVIGHTYKCCTLRFLIQPLEIAAFSDDCAVMWRMLCNPWEEKQYNVISHIFSSINHHPIFTGSKGYCLCLWCDEVRWGEAGCLAEGHRAVGKSQLLTTGYLWCTSYGTYLLPLTNFCSSPEILHLRRQLYRRISGSLKHCSLFWAGWIKTCVCDMSRKRC